MGGKGGGPAARGLIEIASEKAQPTSGLGLIILEDLQ